MNNTGIIRKIDEKGRIVLPKELRKNLNINSGDDFQILLDDEKIILEKYSYLKNQKNEVNKIVNCFSNVTKINIFLIINNEIIDRQEKLSTDFINIINERKMFYDNNIKTYQITDNIKIDGRMVIQPIVINSDLYGALIIIDKLNIEQLIIYSKIILEIIKEEYK
jgi:AbrB family looped-hinge helix DNA binding protein